MDKNTFIHLSISPLIFQSSRSRIFLCISSASRLKKRSRSRLKKKTGAGAAPKNIWEPEPKNMPLQYRLLKGNCIFVSHVYYLLFTIILLILYFLKFNISSLREKKYFAKLNQ